MRKPTSARSRELTAEQTADLKEKARIVLADVRRQLVYRYPFTGSVSMNMDLIPTRDIRISTAATDGKNVFFDIDFLSTLSIDDRLFILAHELWHAILGHPMRRESREHETWNIAVDMEVNKMLKLDGLAVPKDAVLPEKYGIYEEDLNAENYYDRLMKQKKYQQQNSASNSSSSGGKSSNGSGSSQAGNQTDPSGGNTDGKLEGQFDQHIDQHCSLHRDSTDKVSQDDKYGKLGEDPDFNPSVSQSNTEKMREAAISAVQAVERDRGEVPAHLKKLVNELLDPEIPWQEVLAQFVTRCMGDKTSWSRPHRRYVSSGTYLPSKYGEKLKVAIGLDTSGSTDSDRSKFLGEVNGLVKSFGNYELHLIECDAQVGKYEVYSDDNPLELETQKYTMTGGGGTRLMPIFDKIEAEQIDIDCAVIFTDGYTETFKQENAPEYPVLWIVTADGNTETLKFGEVTKFK